LDPHAEINDFGKVGNAVRGTGRARQANRRASSRSRGQPLIFQRERYATLQRVIVHRCCTSFLENLPLGTKDLFGHENAMYPS